MPNDNAEQIADWNGTQGLRWAQLQRQTDGIVLPFGEAALKVAAAQPGERVIDVGCGCGDTTFDLARQVGAGGRVLGVDVSRPMLDVARARIAPASSASPEFREADAAVAALPQGHDLLYSRFGVMFFDQPVAAFQHLRGAMRPGGRVVFCCWRAPRENPWTMVPLTAARQCAGIAAPAADPNAPGPFAFADEQRTRGILRDAGFNRIELQRFDAPVTIGPDLTSAAENALRIGPTSRFALDFAADTQAAMSKAIAAALAPFATADGAVRLTGSTWIVTAQA